MLKQTGLQLALMVGLAMSAGCRNQTGPRRDTPVTPGVLSPERVDPQFAADWDEVRRAQQRDPGGEDVREAAERLLARDPPLNLRVAAVQATAGYAYSHGQDPEVVRLADSMLAAVESAGGLDPADQHLSSNLQRLRALALARSGDPDRALGELNELALAQEIPETELVIAQATAYDRAGKLSEATLAYVRWRELAAEGSSDAAFAHHRLANLAPRLTIAELEMLARQVSGTKAASCLLAFAGQPVAETGNDWVKRECVRSGSGRHIGILLPRSGKYAGLSDTQYAASLAAVRVLEASHSNGLSVIWADSGSTPEQAQEAANSLMKKGAQVLVGPVGSKNVQAVATHVKGQASVLIPGEGRATAIGVAPSLEARGEVMVAFAKARNYNELIVLGPPSGYTRRVVAGVQRRAAEIGVKVTSLEYPASETSFRKTLAPLLKSLRNRVGLMIVDRIGRAELVVRQLARDGVSPKQALVLTTGEGVGGEALRRGKGLFEGVVLAPVAWPDPEGQAFADFYRQQEGVEPDDQAWLVWRALSQAWRAQTEDSPPAARIVRVESGRLVLDPFQEQLTVRPPETN